MKSKIDELFKECKTCGKNIPRSIKSSRCADCYGTLLIASMFIFTIAIVVLFYFA